MLVEKNILRIKLVFSYKLLKVVVGLVWTDLTPVLPPDRWGEFTVVEVLNVRLFFHWKKRGCFRVTSELKDEEEKVLYECFVLNYGTMFEYLFMHFLE